MRPCPSPEDHDLVALWMEQFRCEAPTDFLVPIRRVWGWLGLCLAVGFLGGIVEGLWLGWLAHGR